MSLQHLFIYIFYYIEYNYIITLLCNISFKILILLFLMQNVENWLKRKNYFNMCPSIIFFFINLYTCHIYITTYNYH